MLSNLLCFSYYHGPNLTHNQFQKLMVKKIPLKVRREEALLMERKWFEYRFMHPLQATSYLADCYFYISSNFKERLEKVRVFWCPSAALDFLESEDCLDFWRLRVSIDHSGLDYNHFLHFAMMHLLRTGGWEKRPAPSVTQYLELSRDEAFMDQVRLNIEKMQGKNFQFAPSPIYRVSNFCPEAAVHQEAHEQFVINQLATRPNPHVELHKAMYELEVLREESVLEAFGPRITQLAKSLCKQQ